MTKSKITSKDTPGQENLSQSRIPKGYHPDCQCQKRISEKAYKVDRERFVELHGIVSGMNEKVLDAFGDLPASEIITKGVELWDIIIIGKREADKLFEVVNQRT